MRKIAITDIHGCLLTFKELLHKEVAFSKKDTLYLLGDYVDRGPNSKGVLDHIFELKEKGYTVNCLRGNHEQMMLQVRENPSKFDWWSRNGGYKTMQSFDLWKSYEMIPKKYWDFIESLPYFFDLKEYVLVHAGFNFNHNYPFLDKESMLWIRRWYLDFDDKAKESIDHKTIIHGHTPTPKDTIYSMFHDLERFPVLNIDAGCFAYGDLCAFDMTNKKLYFHENVDMDTSLRWDQQ